MGIDSTFFLTSNVLEDAVVLAIAQQTLISNDTFDSLVNYKNLNSILKYYIKSLFSSINNIHL